MTINIDYILELFKTYPVLLPMGALVLIGYIFAEGLKMCGLPTKYLPVVLPVIGGIVGFFVIDGTIYGIGLGMLAAFLAAGGYDALRALADTIKGIFGGIQISKPTQEERTEQAVAEIKDKATAMQQHEQQTYNPNGKNGGM